MNTYLFVWNPKRWDWITLEDDIAELGKAGKIRHRWSCGNTKSIQIGDRIFLIRLGTEPKGIIGEGTAVSLPFLGKHWRWEDREALYIDIEFEVLLNPAKEAILSLDILKSGRLAQQYSWTPQASGIAVRPDIIDELEAVWFDFLSTEKIRQTLSFSKTRKMLMQKEDLMKLS